MNVVMAFVCVLLMAMLQDSCRRQKETVQAYNAAASQVHSYRNKEGKQISERQVLLTEYKELKRMVSERDSELTMLKKIVKRSTVTAVVHTVHTRDTVFVKVRLTDTITNVRDIAYTDEWANIDVHSEGDTARIAYSFRNEFVHKSEWRKRNLFSRPVLYGSVMNNNPHTSTDRYFLYQERAPHQTGFKVGIFAVGLGAGIWITKIIQH